MKVLTVFAHHGSGSFCHAVLERFDARLTDAGHSNEIVDLHAIHFDPVISDRDAPCWVVPDTPDEILADMHFRERILASAHGPSQRFVAKRWLGHRDDREIVRMIAARPRPRDVVEQQQKVAAADALAFMAPVFFVGFPAILKGWIERVFTPGFAFDLGPAGWSGDLGARIPLLKHQKALIMQTTLFEERAYQARIDNAIKVLIDDFALHFPGIQKIERVYFYAVYEADAAKRRGYLEKTYTFGLEF
ncbi:MAG: flavodoxin family protein [Gemmatimonadetes bacterium]|nr:flavodoxin family protein [Gemmatimonadota bacterium]